MLDRMRCPGSKLLAQHYFAQKPERSIVTTTTIRASVIAAIVSRMLQVMPRLTHHNSAQHMMTGAMMSSDGKLLSEMSFERAVLTTS
jgi:hypothetical protein